MVSKCIIITCNISNKGDIMCNFPEQTIDTKRIKESDILTSVHALKTFSDSDELFTVARVQGYKGKEVKLPPTNEVEIMTLAPHFCDVIITKSVYGHHFGSESVSRIKYSVGEACKSVLKFKRSNGYKDKKLEKKSHKLEGISEEITNWLNDLGLDKQQVKRFLDRYSVKSCSCMSILKDTILSNFRLAFKNELKSLIEKKIAVKCNDINKSFYVLASLSILQLSFLLDNYEKLENDVIVNMIQGKELNGVKTYVQELMNKAM